MCAAWRAPETFVTVEGQQVVSLETDVFMYGCVLLEVITGHTPYYWLPCAQDVIVYRVRDAHMSPYDAALAEGKLTFVMPDTPARKLLCMLARWCLEYDAHDRPDITHVIACLNDISSKSGLPETEHNMRVRYGIVPGHVVPLPDKVCA